MNRVTRIACQALVCVVLAAWWGCSNSETNEIPLSNANLAAKNEAPTKLDAVSRSPITGAATATAATPQHGAVATDSKRLVDFYTVDHYDKTRNPADDLAITMKRAKAEKKHILVQVGGDWCGWCNLMSNFIETNERVRAKIRENYLVMKVTYDPDQTNEAFLSQYPKIAGYPHLFVLDPDGNLLHSQDTAELEEGHGYNEGVYLAFLDQWKPD
jgi:thiol:disulfide interchange protein